MPRGQRQTNSAAENDAQNRCAGGRRCGASHCGGSVAVAARETMSRSTERCRAALTGNGRASSIAMTRSRRVEIERNMDHRMRAYQLHDYIRGKRLRKNAYSPGTSRFIAFFGLRGQWCALHRGLLVLRWLTSYRCPCPDTNLSPISRPMPIPKGVLGHSVTRTAAGAP